METLKKISLFVLAFCTILLFSSCQKKKKLVNVEATKEYSKFKIKNASFVIRPILNIFLGDAKNAARTAVSRMTADQQKSLLVYIGQIQKMYLEYKKDLEEKGESGLMLKYIFKDNNIQSLKAMMSEFADNPALRLHIFVEMLSPITQTGLMTMPDITFPIFNGTVVFYFDESSAFVSQGLNAEASVLLHDYLYDFFIILHAWTDKDFSKMFGEILLNLPSIQNYQEYTSYQHSELTFALMNLIDIVFTSIPVFVEFFTPFTDFLGRLQFHFQQEPLRLDILENDHLFHSFLMHKDEENALKFDLSFDTTEKKEMQMEKFFRKNTLRFSSTKIDFVQVVKYFSRKNIADPMVNSVYTHLIDKYAVIHFIQKIWNDVASYLTKPKGSLADVLPSAIIDLLPTVVADILKSEQIAKDFIVLELQGIE